MLVDVIVELSAKAIDKTFTYHVPPSLSSQIEIGKRVLVPFGRQQLEGFILNIHQEEEHDYVVKDLLQVMDEHAVLNCLLYTSPSQRDRSVARMPECA